MLPAIVIPAYNRPYTLSRLLTSLNTASYPPDVNVPLVISIDLYNGTPNHEVLKVAQDFPWAHGSKELLVHDTHLGLLKNFYFCGNLTKKFDSVIFLEDDLVVSPVYYQYALRALEFFEYDQKIAGISLYRYAFNGYTHYPFDVLEDGSDVFFMQLPSILGQVWSKGQWERFEGWRMDENVIEVFNGLHAVWSKFDAEDYFPVLTKYLALTDQYYAFPRVSLTTGFGDAGTHFVNTTSYFQVPLQLGPISFRIKTLDVSNLLFDSFMEIKPICLNRIAPILDGYDFDVDLNASKEARNLQQEYVLTVRDCVNPVKTFALAMRPLEANVAFGIQGVGVSLCRRSDILWGRWNTFQARQRLYNYFFSRSRSNFRQYLKSLIFNMLSRIRR